MTVAADGIKTIGVIGAGQMGRGIAQVGAQSGYSVLLADASQDLADKGKQTIEKQLTKLVDKGKISADDSQKTLAQIKPVSSIAEFGSVDLVVEAVSENFDLKTKIFKQLDEVCPKESILASNTSSISITKIAAVTQRPDQVAGMHFMNPVPIMKLVEGIQGLQTSKETFGAVRAVAEKMGKTFVEAQDVPGFAVNRILMPMINEAVTALNEGVASVEDIDTAMKLGTNQPMGPLTLADFIGLDTCLAIMEVLHDGLGDSKYRASPLLKKYVDAGWLGRKSGRGFYQYDK